jgi:hypothetical protein
MLPFELAFSYMSAVLLALRTQTPILYWLFGACGTQLNWLLVVQLLIRSHDEPS